MVTVKQLKALVAKLDESFDETILIGSTAPIEAIEVIPANGICEGFVLVTIWSPKPGLTASDYAEIE